MATRAYTKRQNTDNPKHPNAHPVHLACSDHGTGISTPQKKKRITPVSNIISRISRVSSEPLAGHDPPQRRPVAGLLNTVGVALEAGGHDTDNFKNVRALERLGP